MYIRTTLIITGEFNNMINQKNKYTKRFNFGLTRNSTSHKAGSNVMTIETRVSDGHYSTPSVGLTMTVKEARALQGFLNAELGYADSSAVSVGTPVEIDTVIS